MAKIKKIKEGTATVYPATIPQAVIDPATNRTLPNILENSERALADIIAHLLGRIETLEQELSESKYNVMQVNELSVVDNLKIKGADLFLFGTAAPAVAPDFTGQFFIDTTAGVTYQAKGITNAADWKATSNA